MTKQSAKQTNVESSVVAPMVETESELKVTVVVDDAMLTPADSTSERGEQLARDIAPKGRKRDLLKNFFRGGK
jgi:hypothetical protein